jgi:hypothetical protein
LTIEPVTSSWAVRAAEEARIKTIIMMTGLMYFFMAAPFIHNYEGALFHFKLMRVNSQPFPVSPRLNYQGLADEYAC